MSGMRLDVYTSRLGYKGADWLDVTLTRNVKMGGMGHRGIGLAFAPSWQLLDPFLHKRARGLLSAEDFPVYADAYAREMRVSYVRHRPAWETLLALKEVTLLCFCTDPEECHRTVLAGILGKLGATVNGERGYHQPMYSDLGK